MTPVDVAVRSVIERRGPITYAEVVDAALYAEDGGFYVEGGRAGRGGDFLTSPEVGPLFGEVIARALDAWWVEAGEPAVFVVVEAGAGPGTLARNVLRAAPACGPALRYVLVERSSSQREGHGARLALESPVAAFASLPEPDDPTALARVPAGPIVVSLAELPRLTDAAVVLANELLDNLPFGMAERGEAGWNELLVGVERSRLVEVGVPLHDGEAGALEVLAPDAPVGSRVPLPRAASAWLAEARDLAGPGGRVVAFDYAATTADLAARPWTDWVRTYRHHERGGPPLEALGLQDITCEVAIDQLGAAPASDRSQADWLRAHGIDDLVDEGRRIWAERAALGDLEAVRARSRIGEADALTDPAGLGGFRVLEWASSHS